MGKKSKAKQSGNARAKGTASTPSSAATDSGVDRGGAVGISSSNAATATGNKKQKCVRCFGNIKDLAKAHQCPGCSLLYCWRCEKKAFGECPNGEDCVTRIRRCEDCANANTAFKVLERLRLGLQTAMTRNSEGKVLLTDSNSFLDTLGECIKKDERLGPEAFPFGICGAMGCRMRGCHACITSPLHDGLMHCNLCHLIRCPKCSAESLFNSSVGREMVLLCRSIQREGRKASPEEIQRIKTIMKEDLHDVFALCKSCNNPCCFACLDERSVESNVVMLIEGRNDQRYSCGSCYWSAKPCTNPTCPNEVGVPTKRCGGCHIDRYCSVECQAAAYPSHGAKCEKIQAKREAVMGKADGE